MPTHVSCCRAIAAGRRRRGYGLIGLLITMVIIVVLMSILLTSVNRALTGEGSTKEGTVNTLQDEIQLKFIYEAFYIQAMDNPSPRNRGQFLVPSTLGKPGPKSEDITANLYSAMIGLNYLKPEALISPNEFSNWVEVDEDYDFSAINPLEDQLWDPDFKADLEDISNVSYAHVPLYGERFEENWNNRSHFPILGNRGPKDGVHDPKSLTYGRNQEWGGHMVFGDGNIKFIRTFTPASLTFSKDGVTQPDNLFRIEDGPAGADAILGFTREMTDEGPVLMWD